jgi:hypothetical protein
MIDSTEKITLEQLAASLGREINRRFVNDPRKVGVAKPKPAPKALSSMARLALWNATVALLENDGDRRPHC